MIILAIIDTPFCYNVITSDSSTAFALNALPWKERL
jgi:hypothetical protein